MAQQQRASIFDKIAESTAPETRHPRPTVGDYRLRAVELEHRPDGFKGESFVFTFEVDSAKQTDKEIKPNEVGSPVALTWNVTTNKYGMGEIKACLAAIAGVKATDIKGSDVQKAVSEAQPCKDVFVGCRAFLGSKINDKTGEPYTNYSFYPVSQE